MEFYDTLDFSTLHMAVLTSNLLLSIIAVMILNKKILFNAGYKLISVFLVLTAVRFALPIQFPFVTNIIFPQGISKIIIEFYTPRFSIGSLNFSLFHITMVIWLIGTIFQLCRFVLKNQYILRYILIFGRDVTKDSRYASILSEIYECRTSRLPFRVFELPEIQSPFLFGFLKSYIVIPSGLDCTDKELSYILKHETMHFKHHDLWIKFGTQLLTVIYWWNPFTYLLRNHVNLALEMRIDDNVTQLDKNEAKEYMNCLFRVAEFQDNFFDRKMGNILMIAQNDDTLMTRRFETFMHRNVKKNHALNIALSLLIGCIYVSSYLFIFEAEYYAPTQNTTFMKFSDIPISSYAVDLGNGYFEIYLSDICVEIVDSLDYYDSDIPVLTKEEFEHAQQEKIPEN